LSAFEQAVSVFRQTALALQKEMRVMTLEQRIGARAKEVKDAAVEGAPDELVRQLADATFFSNRYALYFAGQVGLSLIGSKKADIAKQFLFAAQYDSSRNRDLLATKLAGVASDDLRAQVRDATHPLTDDDVKYVLECVFTTWVNQFGWESKPFKDIADQYKLDDFKAVYGNFSIQKGQFKERYDAIVLDDKLMNVKREDVIGNAEYVKEVWQSLLRLAAYDFEFKDNTFCPPSVIFSYGNPGGGKTMTAHALMRSFVEEVCRPNKIPVWAFTHNVTDYGSKYQNETPNQLAALRDKIKNFPGLVVMYAADVDTFLSSRQSGEQSAEESKVTGVYFSFFDGSMIPKNGRFLSIMDANFVDNIDPATKSRLFDKVLELKRFTSPAEFGEYAKRYLTSGSYPVGIADADWEKLGQYLLESPLSNREMSNIFRNLVGNFDVDLALVTKPRAEKIKFRSQYMAGINLDAVIGKCDAFIKTAMEIERRSAEQKKASAMDRWLKALATEADSTAVAAASG